MAADTTAFFGPTFDYEDFNAKARAIDVGVLEYAGLYLPCIRGAVLYLCDLSNTENAKEGFSIKLLLCRDATTASKYLRVCPADPTTGNALIGEHVTFQTIPTHCFFWAYVEPHAKLTLEVTPYTYGWRTWIAAEFRKARDARNARADAAADSPNAEQIRRARELKAREDAKAQKAAAEQRERDRLRQERQYLRELRAKQRADRELLRKHASVCSRCKGPIRPGEPRFETPLGFQCKQCGRDGLWATDAVKGKDAKGRNTYRFGYRRADGIWVCPTGFAGGVLRLRHLYSAAPHNSMNWPSFNGCYRTPLHQYDHW